MLISGLTLLLLAYLALNLMIRRSLAAPRIVGQETPEGLPWRAVSIPTVGKKLFLPFSEFPRFRDVAIGKIIHVELPSSNHLYAPVHSLGNTAESQARKLRFQRTILC